MPTIKFDLETLVNMVEGNEKPFTNPLLLIMNIGWLRIAKEDVRAEAYLRNALNDQDMNDHLRVASFMALTKIVIPCGMASIETLHALTEFEHNPENQKILATFA